MALEVFGAMLLTHLLIFMLAWLIQDYRYAGKEFNRVKRAFGEPQRRHLKEAMK